MSPDLISTPAFLWKVLSLYGIHSVRTPVLGTYHTAGWYQGLTNYSCNALFPNKVITQGAMGFGEGE